MQLLPRVGSEPTTCWSQVYKWWKNFDKKTTSHVVPLLRIEWSLLHHSRDSHCFQWGAQLPRIALSHGGSWPHLIMLLFWPTLVSPQAAFRSIQQFLYCMSVWLTHRHTDRAMCDICSNRPHLMHWREKKRNTNSKSEYTEALVAWYYDWMKNHLVLWHASVDDGCVQLDETKRLHSMQMEELEKRTSLLQAEADGLMKAQQALYVSSFYLYVSLHTFWVQWRATEVCVSAVDWC